MVPVTNTIKSLFLSENKRKTFKLTFYDKLLPARDLYPSTALFPSNNEKTLSIDNNKIVQESLRISESLSSSEDLAFGSCESSQVEVMVADVEDDVTGKEFTLTVGIDGHEMLLGTYIVKSFVRQANRRIRKITAYDRMIFFNVDVASWYKQLTFPMTLKHFRDLLCEKIGILQESVTLPLDSIQIERTLDPESLSGLDVLKAICEINGCFGHINDRGNLIYVLVSKNGPNLASSSSIEQITKYKQKAVYEDFFVESISGVSIKTEDNDIGVNVGTNDNVYTIEGNFLVFGKTANELTTIGNKILNQISGIKYRPARVSTQFRPWLEPGDWIQVKTKAGNVNTIIMNRVITGCQSMMDSFEATGNRVRGDGFCINKEIIQLKGKTATIIKNAEQIAFKLSDLEKKTNSQFQITADKIESTIKRIGDAESLIRQEADKITLKVSKGEISSSLSVESGQVTLRSNRLIIDSTGFKLDGKGNATFTGNITTGSTITGATMSAGNINGTEIVIGAFQAQNDVIKIGDFYSLSDNEGVIKSRDNNVIIQADGGELGSGAAIRVKNGDIFFGSNYSLIALYNYVHKGGWQPCTSAYSCSKDGDCYDDCPRYTCSQSDDGPCEGGDGELPQCPGHCFDDHGCGGSYSCGPSDNACHCDSSDSDPCNDCGKDCGRDTCNSVCSDGCGPGDR